MDTTRWFLLSDGRLRSGWRLLLFAVFFAIAIILFQWLAAAFAPHFSSPAALGISAMASLAAVCLATWLAMSLLERQPFSAVGLAVRRQSSFELAVGIAGGAGLVGAITFVEWTIGVIHFERSGAAAASALVVIGGGAGLFAVSAASEELFFRGYPFQRLAEGLNDSAALVISSIAFGGVHGWNPHGTKLAVANTALAGVLLAAAYLKTRALWMPIGFHFAWNWALAISGLPVSGVAVGRMPWDAIPSSRYLWLSGGDYGPEGGVLASAALALGIACLARIRRPQSEHAYHTERRGRRENSNPKS